MAVRNESVRLSLQDDFTSGMARAAAATALFKRELNDLDGKRISRDLSETATGIDNIDRSSRRAGPEIDRLSGRMRILADAAVTLGPALIPLGAGTIPVLTGALAGLGAAAGGITAAVLAFQGLGDGLKAIDKYQLEPTAENLQAMRVEMEKLGPAGAHFAQFIDDLEPQLRGLQLTARNGIFPGIEDGIDAMLTRLPLVQKVINRLSQEMGDLARDAGESLASDTWTPFFQYVKTDAAPTLDDFARSTGNVALGVANMLVAFAPLTRDFTGGLESSTRAFAEWSQTLDENESFQEFLDTVRESGPRALEFLGAMAGALSGIVQAAEPWGSAVLPVVTGVLDIFGSIASSDVGPALFAAAAGLLAFNRAAAITAKVGPALTATFTSMSAASMGKTAAGIGLLSVALSDLDDKAGLTNTTMGAFAGLVAGGPVGLAIGTGIGQFLDFKDAADQATDSLEAANDAMRANDADAMRSSLESLRSEYDRLINGDAKISDFGSQLDAVKGSLLEWTGAAADMQFTIGALEDSMKSGGDLADLFGETIGQTGAQFRTAAGDAQALSGALAELAGWFDKRAAVRGYKDSIDDLRASLKDGFNREDAANIDAIGTSILQVAENIKSPKVRGNFLAEARAQLVTMAENSAPKAAAAIQEVIDKFDEKGLTAPPIEITADDRRARQAIERTQRDMDILGRSVVEPTIDAEDRPARAKVDGVKGLMKALDSSRATPQVNVNPGNSFSILGGIQSALSRLVSKTITVTVRRVGSALPTFADGGYTGPGRKYEPAGIVHRGEVVLPQEIVRRDWGTLKSRYGHLPGFADGGLVQNTYARSRPEDRGGRPAAAFIEGLAGAAQGLKGLEQALAKSEKALAKEKSKRDAVLGQMSELSSSVVQGLRSDIFARSEASGNPWAAGATAGGVMNPLGVLQADISEGTEFLDLVQQLKGRGLSGPALAEVLQSGDVERARFMASLSASDLATYQQLYATREQVLAQTGAAAGQAAYGAILAPLEKAYQAELAELREIKQAIKAADKNNKDGHDRNADRVTAGVNGAAGNGHRRGKRGPR